MKLASPKEQINRQPKHKPLSLKEGNGGKLINSLKNRHSTIRLSVGDGSSVYSTYIQPVVKIFLKKMHRFEV